MTAALQPAARSRTTELIDELVGELASQITVEVTTRLRVQLAGELDAATSTAAPPPAPKVIEAWLGVPEAANRSRRHPQTIRAALREYVRTKGKRGLRGSQPTAAARWRIRPEDLEAWLAGEQPKKRRP